MHKLDLVKGWMAVFGQECPTAPALPPQPIASLRDALIMEESLELYESENTTQALDAIADLLYVVHGAAVAYGFSSEQVDAAFKEVHRSNMTKLWSDSDIAASDMSDKTAQSVHDESGTPTDYYVVRKANGKVAKPPSYSPPNLEPILRHTAHDSTVQ